MEVYTKETPMKVRSEVHETMPKTKYLIEIPADIAEQITHLAEAHGTSRKELTEIIIVTAFQDKNFEVVVKRTP